MFLTFAGILALFGFVLFYGAPYLPTLRRQSEAALDLLDLKKGQTLYELGCGDGRVLKLAARRGLKAVGYELNPLLVAAAWLNTLRYRRRVKVIWGNFWNADLKPADGIYVFLLDRFMEKLDGKLRRDAAAGTKVASYAFEIPGKKPSKQKAGVFLYKY